MQDYLSHSDSKLIKSLQQKKYRDAEGLFVAEGVKLVGEVLEHPQLIKKIVYAGDSADLPYQLPAGAVKVSPHDLEKISSLKTPNRILAVCHQLKHPHTPILNFPLFALDGVSDPGNLGTIIRLCDWFGFGQLICSNDTADVYNPKVVQASMGSILRVAVAYLPLAQFLSDLPKGHVVLGADMDGDPIYGHSNLAKGVVVMGSEAHGIRPEIRNLLTNTVSIPRFGGGESLNVAVSTAIIAAEIRRQHFP